jgi:hypothetical protein
MCGRYFILFGPRVPATWHRIPSDVAPNLGPRGFPSGGIARADRPGGLRRSLTFRLRYSGVSYSAYSTTLVLTLRACAHTPETAEMDIW